MHRKQVISSHILSIGYDEQDLILEIEFSNHALYHYYDVPYNVYNRLMKSTSHGSFLKQYIEKSYKYKRI